MDTAFRIFLVVSGDSGPRVEFFWPPLNDETKNDDDDNDDDDDEKEDNNDTKEEDDNNNNDDDDNDKEDNVGLLFNFDVYYNIPLSHLGDILWPPHRYHHKIFELKIDNILFISYPFCWPKQQLRKPKELDGFNIIFTINLNNKYFINNKLCKQNKTMWFDIIIKYVRIIQHEERRIGYLSSQLMKMNEITSNLLSKFKLKNNKKIKINNNIITNILSEMCDKCRIANDIKQIEEILSSNDEIKILINGWVELHCSLKPLGENIIIRPYHTLLLLPSDRDNDKNNNNDDLRCIRKDAFNLLQEIPISGSQSLRLMISTANICSSFGDMASLTNIPLPTLFHFALHLKYWGKAKIIETINRSSKFVINPNINFLLINKNSIYQKQFSLAFPHRKSLIKQLEIFNYSEDLSKMLIKDRKYIHIFDDQSQQKQDFIFLIAWMLQRNLLIRIFKYYNYIGGVTTNNNNNNHQTTNNKLKILFDKVKPYFNGENHILEIMFQTGLSSKKLQLVIDEFQDQLITCSHPKEY